MSTSTEYRSISIVSAVAKVKRANRHIHDMEEVCASINADGFRIFATDEADGVNVGMSFEPVLRAIPILCMMAGDAVHNLRTALDHLAYQIVSAAQKPPNYLYFPIADTLASLEANKSFQLLSQIAPQIATVIQKEIKPYGEDNMFVKLNKLDRVDKHRFLLVHSVSGAADIFASLDDNSVPEGIDAFILIAGNPTRTPKTGSKAAIHNENFRHRGFQILFDKGLPLEHEEVIRSLKSLSTLVGGAIQTLVNKFGIMPAPVTGD